MQIETNKRSNLIDLLGLLIFTLFATVMPGWIVLLALSDQMGMSTGVLILTLLLTNGIKIGPNAVRGQQSNQKAINDAYAPGVSVGRLEAVGTVGGEGVIVSAETQTQPTNEATKT